VKLIHIFFVAALLMVAFLSVSAPTALADGTDPIVFTKGCGGLGQPACKTVLLTPGETTVTVSETFNCTGTTTDTCSAIEDVINESGATVTHFDLAFNPVSVHGIPLSFSCAPPPTEGSFLFTCNSLGGNTFAFTGGSLCSDSDDLVDGVFTPDGDECGVIIGLQGIAGEPSLQGVTVTSTFSTPEPSSAVLLLFGLMAGLVGFKSVRNILA
jgi:PEP-CTERM motif